MAKSAVGSAPKAKAKANKPSTNSAAAATPLDKFRWWGVYLVFAAAVFAYYYFADIAMAWRLLALTAVGLACVAAVYTTARGVNLRRLAHDARLELAKVVWPGRQEVMQATAIILLVVFLLVLILWGVDSVFAWMVSRIL